MSEDPALLKSIDNPEAFAELSSKVRFSVLLRLSFILEIEGAGKGKKGATVAKAAKAMHTSGSAVNRYLARYRATGWRGLIDGRKREDSGLPPAFRRHVESVFLADHSTKPASLHKALCKRWQKWRETGAKKWRIPGYDVPPSDGGSGHPKGWSVDNLARLMPTLVELRRLKEKTAKEQTL
ncbi:helix-turn-helix domain-containing protein [Haloferula sp. BvORR071]|uniref:helix-turn-helix domain-containing protein n=1 Tax=Haloferula sp. BvORR071 TaxID=1396141 RepID=UPI00054DBABF|nr:helix-turn-helix domain-containing protein [Haloferula sp. BvORR071]